MTVAEARAADEADHIDVMERRYPQEGPLRRATQAEVDRLRADLDARYFPSAEVPLRPCYQRQRRQGASGD